MKILFVGDITHPNARSWLQAIDRYTDDEVDTFTLATPAGPFARARRAVALAKSVRHLKDQIAACKPDIVIAYRTTSYGFLAAATGFRPTVLAAQGESDVWPPGKLSTPLKELMARIAVRHASLYHAWGPHMARTLARQGANPSDIIVSPRGVDLGNFTPPTTPPKATPLRIAVTRGLSQDYCHNTILEAVAKLPASLDWRLEIVGDGPLRGSLSSLAGTLGVTSRVVFHGRKAPEDVAAILQQCHLYVSLPVSEGVSASLLEAFACGVTPVVSDLEANRAFVKHGVNGLLSPINDAEALTRNIVSASGDSELRHRSRRTNLAQARDRASIKGNIGAFRDRYAALTESK